MAATGTVGVAEDDVAASHGGAADPRRHGGDAPGAAYRKRRARSWT
jgi:hypothetical protein